MCFSGNGSSSKNLKDHCFLCKGSIPPEPFACVKGVQQKMDTLRGTKIIKFYFGQFD